MTSGTSGLLELNATERLHHLISSNHARNGGTGGVTLPPRLQAQGFTAVAVMIDKADDTVRHYWREDRLAGRSLRLPPPDVLIHRLIARADGTEDTEELPGWSETSVREWMQEHPASRATASERAVTSTGHGYAGAARIMGIADHTVRHYWREDLLRGYSHSMPQPDVAITRLITRADGAQDVEVLPGWSERTLREWMPTRQGKGNHTRGAQRRGYSGGRGGWGKGKSA